MKLCISGASGLVGTALGRALSDAGHEVVRLARSSPGPRDISWNVEAGTIEANKLNGLDGVAHLAGESIAAGRWTAAKKARIRDSRVAGTRLLANALASLSHRPRVLVSASAIGYYGSRGDLSCDENAAPGDGFLPQVCREWEAATQPAEAAGIRVVHLRTGIVLSTKGGALAKMLTPFKLGGGGIVGDGKQYWSWITLDDLVGAIIFCLENESVRGPVNGVAPQATTNAEFTRTLGHVLRRPTLIPMPAFAARLVLGEMADALLLASARVVPAALEQHGYAFKFPQLETALRHVLK